MPIFLLFVKNQRLLHCQLVELIITFTFCGAFSVSPNAVFTVIEYIKNQRAHHKAFDFKKEMISYYIKYKIDYNEKYIWD